MKISYISTRGDNTPYLASEAVLKGIAHDGGLFVPTNIPKMDMSSLNFINMDYKKLAYEVLKLYMTDYSEQELKRCIEDAYTGKFDNENIVPVIKADDVFFLELFHGKTLAFKDMALCLLPHLLKTAAVKNNINKKIIILTATSGDTGKAALEGFKDVEGVSVIVLYPKNGVSKLQEIQMLTQEGNNVCVVAVEGNFDDAQSAVKSIFNDNELNKKVEENGYIFSSANSINIGRLIPQIVYYLFGYFNLIKNNEIKSGEEINITVPTGNFGNILAAYYAKKMGLPVKKLICASNKNKVLYDFFNTGSYDKNREFYLTSSPSMDILISSNLERLLYHLSEDQNKTKYYMESLNKSGNYKVDLDLSEFYGEYASEEDTMIAIKQLYEKTGYIVDTHTAVGYSCYEKYKNKMGDINTKNIIAATASPYKFAKDVVRAIDPFYEENEIPKQLGLLSSLKKEDIPDQINGIYDRPILHNNICAIEDIKKFVDNSILGNNGN